MPYLAWNFNHCNFACWVSLVILSKQLLRLYTIFIQILVFVKASLYCYILEYHQTPSLQNTTNHDTSYQCHILVLPIAIFGFRIPIFERFHNDLSQLFLIGYPSSIVCYIICNDKSSYLCHQFWFRWMLQWVKDGWTKGMPMQYLFTIAL